MPNLCRSEWTRGVVREPLVQNTLIAVTSQGVPVYAADLTTDQERSANREPRFSVYVGEREICSSTGIITDFNVFDNLPLFRFLSLTKFWEGAEEEIVHVLADPPDKSGQTLNLVGGGPISKFHYFAHGDRFLRRHAWTEFNSQAPSLSLDALPPMSVTIEEVEYDLKVKRSGQHVKLVLQPVDPRFPTIDYDSGFEQIIFAEPRRPDTVRFYCHRGTEFVEVEVHPRDQMRTGDSVPPPPSAH